MLSMAICSKINRGNTVCVCQFQSQKRKADVCARCDYKIMSVFFQQTDEDSKDIPLESSLPFQRRCHCSRALRHLVLESPSESICVGHMEKKNKPLHPTSLLTEKFYYQFDYSPNSPGLASDGFQLLLSIRSTNVRTSNLCRAFPRMLSRLWELFQKNGDPGGAGG